MISRAWVMVVLVTLAALALTLGQGYAQSDLEYQLAGAAGDGNIAKVEQLLDAGVNPNCGQNFGIGTPLYAAAVHPSQKNLEVMELLLEKGADPNLQTKDSRTPLMILVMQPPAGRAEIVEMIRLLLKAGADVNVRGKDGKTALQLALQYRAPKQVVDLLTQAQKRSPSR